MAVPPSVVTGTPITAAWGNQVADALVNPFSSTGARSSGIASPTAGQTTCLTTNTATEGLEVYNSAGEWRKPWNLPWGQVAYSTTTTASSTTSGTTETLISTSGSFTAVANRLYKVTWTSPTLGTATDDLFAVSLRLTNTSGAVYSVTKLTVVGGSFQQNHDLICYVTGLTAGSKNFVITATRQAGTGTLQTLSGGNQFWIIEDIGPTGAPA